MVPSAHRMLSLRPSSNLSRSTVRFRSNEASYFPFLGIRLTFWYRGLHQRSSNSPLLTSLRSLSKITYMRRNEFMGFEPSNSVSHRFRIYQRHHRDAAVCDMATIPIFCPTTCREQRRKPDEICQVSSRRWECIKRKYHPARDITGDNPLPSNNPHIRPVVSYVECQIEDDTLRSVGLKHKVHDRQVQGAPALPSRYPACSQPSPVCGEHGMREANGPAHDPEQHDSQNHQSGSA